MNSKYVNNAGVSIAEVARLTFFENTPQGESEVVVVVSMHVEFLKELHRVIGDTLEQHETNVKAVRNRSDA